MAKRDQDYASKGEVHELSLKVHTIGRDSRNAKEGVDALTKNIEDITKELQRKPSTAKFFTIFGALSGAFLTIAILFLTLYFSDHLPAVVDSKLSPINEKVGRMETKVDSLSGVKDSISGLNERIGKIEASLDLLLNGIIRHPTAGPPQQVKTKMVAASAILTEAEKGDIALEPELIKEGGLELIKYELPASELAPYVAETLTRYVDYRSFLNQKLQPVPVAPGPVGQAIKIGPHSIVEYNHFVLQGFTQELDRGRWSNSLFIDCTIIYRGGELRLNDVRFQDCKFEIEMNSNGKKFAQALLSSNPVTEYF